MISHVPKFFGEKILRIVSLSTSNILMLYIVSSDTKCALVIVRICGASDFF